MDNRNRTDKFFTMVFMLAITAPLAISFFTGGNISSSENRTLAPLPVLHAKGGAIKAFPGAFDAFYKDHFGFRGILLTLNAQIGLTQRNQPNALTVTGKNSMLFYLGDNSREDMLGRSPFKPQELRDWEASLRQRNTWLARQGIPYLFVVAPDKHSIYPENLPFYLQSQDGKSRLHQLLQDVASGGAQPILPLEDAMKRAKAYRLPLYFNKDTHWNHLGAYFGYAAIMNGLPPSPAKPAALQLPPQQFHPALYTEGDLARMAQLSDSSDTDLDPGLSKTSCLEHQPAHTPGGFKIDDISKEQDGFFETTCPSGKGTLLIFRDSFGRSLAPYLSTSFRRVIYVWTHADNKLFSSLVKQEKPDYVIEERVERYMKDVPKTDPLE